MKSLESVALPLRLSKESFSGHMGPRPQSFEHLGSFYPFAFEDESPFNSGYSNDPLGNFLECHMFRYFLPSHNGHKLFMT